jgi:hypothetical protein
MTARWDIPVNLGPTVNSSSWDDYPNISADGLSLYFFSTRAGGYGRGDLYVATRRSKDGDWERPKNLGAEVNTSDWEMGSQISPDGLSLFLSSGLGHNDIYLSRRASTSHPWSMPVTLGSPVNTHRDEYNLTFSEYGSVLYFSRGDVVTGPGPAVATCDIWQVEVTPIVDLNGDGIVDGMDVSIMIDYWHTNEPLCDIAPAPLGDGFVDIQDLTVLSEHLFEEVPQPGR